MERKAMGGGSEGEREKNFEKSRAERKKKKICRKEKNATPKTTGGRHCKIWPTDCLAFQCFERSICLDTIITKTFVFGAWMIMTGVGERESGKHNNKAKRLKSKGVVENRKK